MSLGQLQSVPYDLLELLKLEIFRDQKSME
jgi:hypothetical protein